MNAKKLCKNEKLLVILLLIAALAGGLSVSSGYGTYFDFWIEHALTLSNIRDYSSFGHSGYMAEEIDRDHGVALYYIFGIMGKYNIPYHTVYNLWRYYTFVIFFCGCLALYGIMRDLFHRRMLSLFTFGLLFLSPRFFAEAHYNHKDIILLSVGLITLYFGIRFIRTQKISFGIAYAISAAFMTNIKIIGIWYFGIIGIFYLLANIPSKKINFQKFFEGLCIIFLFIIVFVLITPASWGNLFAFIQYCFSGATEYAGWQGTVLYAGKELPVPLPADYLPLQILFTTPLPLLLLCLAGHITAIKSIFSRSRNALIYGMLLLTWCFPFLYALLDRDLIIYNGWRHFYFLYGPLVIFMGIGGYAISKIRKGQKLMPILSGGLMLYLAFLLLIGHPYQYSYINFLAKRPAEENWQLDYWCVTEYQVLEKLYKSNDRNPLLPLTVSGPVNTLSHTIITFGNCWNYEITYLDGPDAASANYLICNQTYDRQVPEEYHLLFSVNAYGNCLYRVYERNRN